MFLYYQVSVNLTTYTILHYITFLCLVQCKHLSGVCKVFALYCLNRGLHGLRGGRGRGFLCISSLLSQVGLILAKPHRHQLVQRRIIKDECCIKKHNLTECATALLRLVQKLYTPICLVVCRYLVFLSCIHLYSILIY